MLVAPIAARETGLLHLPADERCRDGKFPALMDVALVKADIKTVLTSIRMPQVNSIMKRLVQSYHHEPVPGVARGPHGAGERPAMTSPAVCGSRIGSTTEQDTGREGRDIQINHEMSSLVEPDKVLIKDQRLP